MIVKNNTDKKISVKIKGNLYEVEANDSISGVPSEHAEYWKTMLHNFLVLEQESLPEVSYETSIGEEVKSDVVSEEKGTFEVIIENEVVSTEEKPVKITKSKSKK